MSKYRIYLRKSRQDDANESVEEVLARHEKQLQDYAVRTFGYRIPEEDIYREVVSGETIEDRPQINRIFKEIESADVEGVLCMECSRLSRGDLLDCGTVVHVFRYTNTLVITPTKTFDLSDKHDRKFFEMELMRGNDYLEYIRDTLMRGRSASVHEGNFISSVSAYGYDRIKVGKYWTLAINESEAQYVRMMFQWYAEGIGMTTISNRLYDLGAKPRKSAYFTEGTLRQMLENPVYIGKLTYQRKKVVAYYENGKLVKKAKRQKQFDIIDGKHAPIIDEELFNKVQQMRGKTSKYKTGTELKNIYATILRCKCCGRALNFTTYDTCSYVRPPRYNCRTKKCENRTLYFDKMHGAIYGALKATLNDFELKLNNDTKEIYNSHESLIKSLEKELSDLEIRQEELYDYLEKKIYTQDVFIMRNDKLAKERERLKSSLANAKATMPTIKEYENKIVSLHTALDMLNDESISALAKNTFLKSFVDRIEFQRNNDDEISIDIFLK